ncbi:GNAT family N-acetyltransferase [Actinomadura sp. 9N407]|uniref:GNAT family N-acetyltransferase n=1 Tax=Actinomadura sp. 9N407 TaxID=3375154 RepID=UPI0037967FC4
MLRPDYPLESARLVLRPYTLGDFDVLYDLHSRPEVTRYLLFDVRDRGQVRESLQAKIQAATLDEEGGNLNLVVALRETGAMVGDVVLFWRSREHRQGEIGYVFHPDHGGKGYATEAAEVMLRLGFEELGLHRIVGRIDARNAASARVLERLGMRREAHLKHNEIIKGEWVDGVVYAMLEDEWRAR